MCLLLKSDHVRVAEALIYEAKNDEYSSLILGRRGGLVRVRRRILGSVSELLLNAVPECSFAIAAVRFNFCDPQVNSRTEHHDH